MDAVCSIFVHYSRPDASLICLERILRQERPVQKIVVVNNGSPSDPVLRQFADSARRHGREGDLHIVQMPRNAGNAGGCAAGLDYAFNLPGVNYAWMLDDDSWPRCDTLRRLTEAPSALPGEGRPLIRMALVVDPARDHELTWPLTARSTHDDAEPWQHFCRRDFLPEQAYIPSRGGWLGALYPRKLWETVGAPTPGLFIRGEDEEYPWLACSSGFRTITVAGALLEHPSPPQALIRYDVGGGSFFYEPGIPVSRFYYKTRNWAWIQKRKRPGRSLYLFAACGCCAVLAMNAMLQTGEISAERFAALLCALWNGARGKLRPWGRPGSGAEAAPSAAASAGA